jgi:hypothetical protein
LQSGIEEAGMDAEIRLALDDYFNAWKQDDTPVMSKSQGRLEAMGFTVTLDPRRRAASARLFA